MILKYAFDKLLRVNFMEISRVNFMLAKFCRAELLKFLRAQFHAAFLRLNFLGRNSRSRRVLPAKFALKGLC